MFIKFGKYSSSLSILVPLNESAPIYVIDVGKFMVVKFLHPLKAYPLMVVNVSGNFTDVRFLQK